MNVIGQSPEKFNNIDPIFNGEFFTEYVDFILGTSARCLIYYYTAQKYAPDLSLQQVARLNSNIFFCTFRPGSSDKFKTFEEIATDFETNEYMYRAERSLRPCSPSSDIAGRHEAWDAGSSAIRHEVLPIFELYRYAPRSHGDRQRDERENVGLAGCCGVTDEETSRRDAC